MIFDADKLERKSHEGKERKKAIQRIITATAGFECVLMQWVMCKLHNNENMNNK